MSKSPLKVQIAAEEDSIFHLKALSLYPLHHPRADPILTPPHCRHLLPLLGFSLEGVMLEESMPGGTSHQVLILDGLLKTNLTKIKQKI